MDSIANMFSQIITSSLRHKDTVDIPHSKVKEGIARVLAESGFIINYEALARGGKKALRIRLKYKVDKFGKPAASVISGLKKVSKPGCRVYSGASDLPKIRSGYGTAIVTTSKGIISDRQARAEKVGGEVLGYVW